MIVAVSIESLHSDGSSAGNVLVEVAAAAVVTAPILVGEENLLVPGLRVAVLVIFVTVRGEGEVKSENRSSSRSRNSSRMFFPRLML